MWSGVIPTSVPGFVVETSVPPPPLAPPIVSLGESLSMLSLLLWRWIGVLKGFWPENLIAAVLKGFNIAGWVSRTENCFVGVMKVGFWLEKSVTVLKGFE